jgi:TfoX/Sxy family transcriptional regulator of competence genes
MAYDETLAARVRTFIGNDPAVTEKRMFGGLAFMYRGNMAVGVRDDRLIVRIPAEEHETLATLQGVADFDLTGRPMKGWILVENNTVADDERLAQWVDRGVSFANSLPPK